MYQEYSLSNHRSSPLSVVCSLASRLAINSRARQLMQLCYSIPLPYPPALPPLLAHKKTHGLAKSVRLSIAWGDSALKHIANRYGRVNIARNPSAARAVIVNILNISNTRRSAKAQKNSAGKIIVRAYN